MEGLDREVIFAAIGLGFVTACIFAILGLLTGWGKAVLVVGATIALGAGLFLALWLGFFVVGLVYEALFRLARRK